MRRAYLLAYICIAWQSPAVAFDIPSWFQNTNQKAMKLFQAEAYKDASQTFHHKDWQAAAHYKAGDFQQALSQYQTQSTDDGYYNQGNALAHMGQYQAAIKAYDQALKHNAGHTDAKHNKEIIQALLDQQEQNQDKNQNQEQEQEQPQVQNQNQQHTSDQSQNQEQNQEQNQDQEKNQEQGQNQDPDQQPQNQPKAQNADQDQSEAQPKPQNPSDPQKEQALRLIPDDPGGLLREKFWRDHWRRTQKERS